MPGREARIELLYSAELDWTEISTPRDPRLAPVHRGHFPRRSFPPLHQIALSLSQIALSLTPSPDEHLQADGPSS
jgi:hypothetical protein